MLNSEEFSLLYERAYIPEHLPHYVQAVSSAQPHLHDGYLCFTHKTHFIFIGYPLGSPDTDIQRSYNTACERFRPNTVTLIAPQLWFDDPTFEGQPQDSYYKLALPFRKADPELSYMVRRASTELHVRQGTFGREHRRLVKEFVSRHELSPEYTKLLKRMPQYLNKSSSARLLEARRGDILVAFTIVDLGSATYAFYLFNFRSVERNVPGASDLLFFEMVKSAQKEGKAAINLGLGINPGIRRFKEKWGGTPFLPYHSVLVNRKPADLGSLAEKLC